MSAIEITTVTEQSELFHGDGSDFEKHLRGDDGIERFQCGALIAIGHEKRGNRTGETTQPVPHVIHEIGTFRLTFRGFHFTNHGLCRLLGNVIRYVL